MANVGSGMLIVMARSKRALDPSRNDELRALARSLLEEKFEDNQAAMAREMGITPAMLSDFLNSKRGAGDSVIAGLAKISGKSKAALRGEHVEYERDPSIARMALGQHRDWERAKVEAVARFGRFMDEALLDEVAAMVLSRMPEHLTAEAVKQFHDALAMVKGARR